MACEQPRRGSANSVVECQDASEPQAQASHLITFIHTPDSLPWAQFLQAKLLSDNYSIRSIFQTPNLPDGFSFFSRLIALIVSPELLEQAYSSFWATYVEQHRGPSVVILLGVDKEDIKEVLGKSTCARVLSRPWVQVTDQERSTVSQALVKLIEMYESASGAGSKDRTLFAAQGSLEEEAEEDLEEEEEEEEIEEEEDGEVGRLRNYGEDWGDDDDPYDIPRSSRQLNRIVKVLPTILFEGAAREVMVVMEREADWPLTLVLGVKDGPSHHVNMTHVASSAYIATIPNNVQGRVPFRVECGVSERCTIGSASILIRPRLDQLRLLLEREVSPLAVLCKAVGPLTEAELAESPAAGQDSQVEDLDALLARRLSLSQLPPGLMEILCPEDLGTGAPEISPQTQWPTVLHFAAEFNLEQVCEALLEYPGMLHAACTENCHGLFPCMLAKKGGFHSLHSRLLQYVEDMSASDEQYKRAADSGISFLETLPPPRCRGSLDSSTYVNDTRLSADMGSDVTDDDEFVKQGIMYAKNKARSCSEGCVRTPYARRPSTEKRIAEEEDIYDTPPPSSPPPLKPKKVGRARSVVEGLPAAASRLPTPHPHHHLHETPPRTPPRPLPPRPSAGGSHSPEGSGGIQSQLSPDLAEQKRGPSPSPSAAAASSSSSSAASSFPSTAAGEPAEATTKAAAVPGDGQEGGDGVVPRGLMLPASSASGLSLPLQEEDDDTLTEEEAASMRCRTKRSGSLQEKLSLFFHKIKTPRRNRSSSETNLAAFGKGQKKVYVRQSTMSTKSDSTNNSSSSGRFSIVSEHESSERDSGAVCDDTTSTVQLRSKEKNKARCTGKRKGASVKKRMSIRVLRAKNEDLSETPSLPPRPINSSSSNSSQLESTSINLRL